MEPWINKVLDHLIKDFKNIGFTISEEELLKLIKNTAPNPKNMFELLP